MNDNVYVKININTLLLNVSTIIRLLDHIFIILRG